MKIIISPAKKMNADTDSLPWRDLPAFLSETQQLAQAMQGMSYGEIAEELNTGVNTPRRWINGVLDKLSVLLWGLEELPE